MNEVNFILLFGLAFFILGIMLGMYIEYRLLKTKIEARLNNKIEDKR